MVPSLPPTATHSDSLGHEIPESPICTGSFSEFRIGASWRSVHFEADAVPGAAIIAKTAIAQQLAMTTPFAGRSLLSRVGTGIKLFG